MVSKDATNCVETETQNCTWDMRQKKICTLPPLRICPLFDELKKGDFFYPLTHGPCMDRCLLLSNSFFWKASISWWMNLSFDHGCMHRQTMLVVHLFDKESCLWGKLIYEESWLIRKVNWWGKLLDKESWLMRKVN